MAVAPDAGTAITNTVTANYVTGDGRLRSASSNTVSATSGDQIAFSLVEDIERNVAPGQVVVLSHIFTNEGNGELPIGFELVNLTGDGFDLDALQLFYDNNDNGVVDTTDDELPLVQLADGILVSLPPGATVGDLPDRAVAASIPATPLSGGGLNVTRGGRIPVLVQGRVPVAAPLGSVGQLRISARSADGTLRESNVDSLTISSGSSLSLSKAASTTEISRNELLTYTLQLTNNGIGTAGPVDVVIDGVAVQKLVIRDQIPANTTYEPLDPPAGQLFLVHRYGDPTNTYVTYDNRPADDTQVDVVALAIDSLASRATVAFSFAVRVHGNASGTIENVALAHYSDGGVVSVLEAYSNQVVTEVPLIEPVIHYYYNNQFGTLVDHAILGDPLYVATDAASCNENPVVIEKKTIIITSTMTGDEETFIATETGPNTGIFRIVPTDAPNYVPTQDATLTNGAIIGNSVIETLRNDTLTATVDGCGTSVVKTRILVDPTGVVYDTCKDVPVPDAVVSLVDAVSGAPAQVFELDAVTPAANVVTVGNDGVYLFPLVNPGTYRLEVVPPTGFTYPSTVPVAQQPATRIINVPASFGGDFPVNLNTGAVVADIPVDCTAHGSLFIRKSASVSTVEVGESLLYTVEVKNTGDYALFNVKLDDTLPLGFSYLPGSAKENGSTIADPDGSAGPALTFSLSNLAVGATATLTYRVRVGTAALRGDGVNTAIARAQETLIATRDKVSNTATAKVEVTPGVFADDGYLVGKVFTDCNRNRVQDKEELGIPGVRLYLDDGTYVVTDVEGKYSLYGLRPRTHVIKLDRTTLPPEAELITLDNRHAGVPDSRFVDLRKGELHRADFAEGSCNAELISQVKLRRSKGEIDVHEYYLNQELPLDPTLPQQRRVQDLPAQGVLDGDKFPGYQELLPEQQYNAINSQLPEAPVVVPVVPAESFEKKLPNTSIEPGFLDLEEGDLLAGREATIRVKGLAGAQFRLLVNGAAVDEERIGNRATQPSRQLQGWEYVGVKLAAGANRLEFQQLDNWGNVRGGQAITVYAPGEPVGFAVDLPKETPADGNSPVRVRIRLVDANGNLVAMRLPVSVESKLGRWKGTDLDEVEPGLQQFIENGQLELSLLPPQEPGEETLRILSGRMEKQVKFGYTAPLREMIAVGIIEGQIRLDRLLPGAVVQPTVNDSFEEELRNYSYESDDGETRAGARASFFLKGKVKGEYLLTMAYDSDKAEQSRLFRDIQPEEYYPVYGDSSIRGFDAQTTSPLYLRVEKGRTYLLYGDYNSRIPSEARKLGNYQRSLTGLRLHHEDDGLLIDTFVSQDNTTQVVDEIRGQGISGPYRLSNADVVVNSEQVEILVRDRQQPSIILSRTSMTRFTDYEIDGMSGGILFRTPVASVDEKLNPVSIRVTYEVEQGGDDFLVAGATVQKQFGGLLEVGGTYVHDENPTQSYRLRSANATLKLDEQTNLVVEGAQSQEEGTGEGDARRVELIHKGERTDLRLYASDIDVEFVNPGASLSAGRREAGAKGGFRLSEKLQFTGEVLRSEDLTTGGVRDGANLQMHTRLTDNLTWMAGVRRARESTTPALSTSVATPIDQTSIQTGIDYRLPMLPELSLSVEYEQAIDDATKEMAAIGAEYQFSPRGRLYARHELISSLNDAYGLNNRASLVTSVIGLRNDYSDTGSVFSEYRARDAFEGRETEAAIGLRNRWPLRKGLMLETGLERVQPLDGDPDNLTNAITGAISYTANPLWKGTARLEVRTANNNDSLLSTLGVARKMNRDWTLLGNNHYYVQRLATGDLTRDRFQLGVAYRDTDTNIWHGFSKYELRSTDDETVGDKRLAHIVSLHANRAILDSMYLSGRFATKWVQESANDGFEDTYSAQLLSTRYIWDFTERWDFNLTAATLYSAADKSTEYGLGVELGYLLHANLWLSGGYNVFGYQDEELSGEGYTQRGAYLRLRFKFDETLFDRP